jgi:hypothetical protein
VVAEVRDLSREHTPEAINTSVSIMQDDKANPSESGGINRYPGPWVWQSRGLPRGYDGGNDFSAFLRSLDERI